MARLLVTLPQRVDPHPHVIASVSEAISSRNGGLLRRGERSSQ
jgi:hypothetical protein